MFGEPPEALWEAPDLKPHCSLDLFMPILWLDGHSDTLGFQEVSVQSQCPIIPHKPS